MPKDTDNSDNPELLNALESIKGLLELSENKLSAARESLKKAKSPDIKPAITRPSVSSEPVVPVLDDIVETTEDNEPSLLDDLPVLENYLEPEETISPEPPQPLPPSGHSTDEVLAYLDQLQLQLDKELNETLMSAVIDIEAELKKTLNEEILKLKEQLIQSDED